MLKPIKLTTENFLLLAVLVFAAVMRFWGYLDWNFTNDELSAITRLNYSSFNDLYINGIVPDAHPVATQYFLYVWTNWFGTSEFSVRLPFVALSVFSCWGIFLLGKKWSSFATGVLAAILFAGLGYFINYSVLARPYGMGVFFIVMALNFWTNLLLTKRKIPFLQYVGFAFFAALAAYTHYMAAVTIALVWFVGIAICHKKQLKSYLFMGVFSGVLYIPGVLLFLKQFSASGGGTQWLNAPTINELTELLSLLYNSTWIVLLFAGTSLIIKIIVFKERKIELRLVWSVVLALTCVLFTYFYSIYKSPIFQFSVVIFGVVAALLFFAEIIKINNSNGLLVQSISLMALLFYTTNFNAKFNLNESFSTFQKIADTNEKWAKEYPNILQIASLQSPKYVKFYHDKSGVELNYFFKKLDYKEPNEKLYLLAKKIANNKGSFVSMSQSNTDHNPQSEAIIKLKYGKLIAQVKGYNWFSRLYEKGDDNQDYLMSEIAVFPNQLKDTLNNYLLSKDSEFGFDHRLIWKNTKISNESKGLVFKTSMKIKASSYIDFKLVTEVKNEKDSTIQYTTAKSEQFQINNREFTEVVSAVKLPMLNPNYSIKTYLWNTGKQEILVKEVKYQVYEN